MNIVIVLGTGNSGAGAIHDFLWSRDDFQSPFDGKEFRVVNDPNGINDLYFSLYKNFSLNGSADSFRKFHKFTKDYYYSRYNQKHKILDKNFLELSNKFINDITSIKYNGGPQFFFDKLSLTQKINFYFKRFVFNKNSRNIRLLDMVLPCKEKVFLEHAKNYLYNILRNSENFDQTKNVVLEQSGNFITPLSSTKFYGEKRKVLFVTRNPKAIYWSMKRRNSLSYPGHDIKIFVSWYKNLMKKINHDEHKNVIKIKFEDFFENFEQEKDLLIEKLGLEKNIKNTFDLKMTMRNLHKYKDNLSSDEIKFIDENLNEFY